MLLSIEKDNICLVHLRKIFDLQQKFVSHVVNINMSMSGLQTLLNRYHYGVPEKVLLRGIHPSGLPPEIVFSRKHRYPYETRETDSRWKIGFLFLLFCSILYFTFRIIISLPIILEFFNFMWFLKVAYLFAIFQCYTNITPWY